MQQKRLLSVLLALVLAFSMWGGQPATSAQAAGIIYYSQTSGDPVVLTHWNTNRLGGGSTPANFSGDDIFVIQNGHTMTTTAAWAITGATGAVLQIESGGTLTETFAVTVDMLQIDNGGTYNHNVSNSTLAGTTKVFGATSTVVINAWNGTGFNYSGVTFGNLTLNFTTNGAGAVSVSAAVPAGATMTINGNFIIQATGGGDLEFQISNNNDTSLMVGGSFEIQGGRFDFTNSAVATNNYFLTVNGNVVLGPGGTWDQNGGTLWFTYNGGGVGVTSELSGTFITAGLDRINWMIVGGGGRLRMNSNHPVGAGRTFAVYGMLNIGPYVLSGAGDFVLDTDATLELGSPDGISSSGTATGNIQVTGARTFGAKTNYSFNGAAAQITGTGFPATSGYLNIDNSAGVTLSGDLTVNWALSLTSGNLSTSSSTLTLEQGASCSGDYDVLGTTQRTHTITTGMAYCLGNPNVQITVANGSTAPSSLSSTLTTGTAPFTGGVQRKYTLSAPGFSGTATLRLHYQDAELNGLDESNLELYRFGTIKWHLQGRTGTVDTVNNWVEKTGVTAFSDWALSDPGVTAVDLYALKASSAQPSFGAWLAGLLLACGWVMIKIKK